jgi:hypothetical protein
MSYNLQRRRLLALRDTLRRASPLVELPDALEALGAPLPVFEAAKVSAGCVERLALNLDLMVQWYDATTDAAYVVAGALELVGEDARAEELLRLVSADPAPSVPDVRAAFLATQPYLALGDSDACTEAAEVVDRWLMLTPLARC